MGLSLAAILSESATRYPDRDAVVMGPQRISYARLWEESRRYAAVLRDQGIGPGDRVALLVPNVTDFPRAYYAVLSLGAVVVPVHALLVAREIGFVLTDSQAKLLIAAGPLLEQGVPGAQQAGVPVLALLAGPDGVQRLDDLAATAEPIPTYVEREPQDEAVILYTSGTTGAPKGAVLTQLNMTINAMMSASNVCGLTPDDVILGCLPLFHSFGQTCAMNAGFYAGSTLVLLPRFDGAAALDLIVKEQVNVFEGVPTMYIALLAAAREDERRPVLRGGVRWCEPAGRRHRRVQAGVRGRHLRGLRPVRDLSGGDVQPGGLRAETGHRRPADLGHGRGDRRPGDRGADRVLPQGEVGEVVLRGHNIFAGYLNNPAATRAVLVTAGSAPATWAARTPTDSCPSSTGRRT